jgi:hypothetical protein
MARCSLPRVTGRAALQSEPWLVDHAPDPPLCPALYHSRAGGGAALRSELRTTVKGASSGSSSVADVGCQRRVNSRAADNRFRLRGWVP